MTTALEGPRVSWCLHRGNSSRCWAVLPAPSAGLQEATGQGCGEVGGRSLSPGSVTHWLVAPGQVAALP